MEIIVSILGTATPTDAHTHTHETAETFCSVELKRCSGSETKRRWIQKCFGPFLFKLRSSKTYRNKIFEYIKHERNVFPVNYKTFSCISFMWRKKNTSTTENWISFVCRFLVLFLGFLSHCFSFRSSTKEMLSTCAHHFPYYSIKKMFCFSSICICVCVELYGGLIHHCI